MCLITFQKTLDHSFPIPNHSQPFPTWTQKPLQPSWWGHLVERLFFSCFHSRLLFFFSGYLEFVELGISGYLLDICWVFGWVAGDWHFGLEGWWIFLSKKRRQRIHLTEMNHHGMRPPTGYFSDRKIDEKTSWYIGSLSHHLRSFFTSQVVVWEFSHQQHWPCQEPPCFLEFVKVKKSWDPWPIEDRHQHHTQPKSHHTLAVLLLFSRGTSRVIRAYHFKLKFSRHWQSTVSCSGRLLGAWG